MANGALNIPSKDEMLDTIAGAKKQPTSPALAGQPPSVTGQEDPAGIGNMPTTGTSGLASAPPPGGNAQVGGTPLSSNGANERQGGAGADLDLVKDRGTPTEYWNGNIDTSGSKVALQTMSDAMSGSSGKTGQFATMDPEEVRRAGNRMNEALGIGTRQTQDQIVEGAIYQPMAATIKKEMDNGTISPEDGAVRMAQTMANVQGVESEEELEEIVVTAMKRTTGETKKEGFFKRVKKRMRDWWNKGKDDPETEVREDQTVEVTKFMGGMTRQELGMFIFQWGGLMMANADQGFGGAMGAAGLGAMEGHMARQDRATEKESAAAAAALDERRVAAQERTAAMSGLAQGFTDDEGWWKVPVYDPETKTVTWETAKDKDGNPVKGDPAKKHGYQGEKTYLEDFFRKAGWSDQQIADYFGKAKGDAARRQDLIDALNKRIDGAGITEKDPLTGKKYREFGPDDIKAWVERMMKVEAEMSEEAAVAAALAKHGS